MKDDARVEVEDHLLPLKQVAARLCISVRTVWRMVGAGKLPKPIRIGREAALFASEVNDYLARLKTSRKPQQGRL
jgi:predicted DNA-binding transcriptional regulator AlpA